MHSLPAKRSTTYLPPKTCNLRSRRASTRSQLVRSGGQESDTVADADWKQGEVGGGRVHVPR
jgi:hypothetical protein